MVQYKIVDGLLVFISTDVKRLRKMAVQRPFPIDSVVVLVEALEPSCSVVVSNIPPQFQSELIAMYFESLLDACPAVTRKGETKAVVTFDKPEGKKCLNKIYRYNTHVDALYLMNYIL